jgi:hypothetical protein
MNTRRYIALAVCLLLILVLAMPQGVVFADQPTPFTDERYGTCWNVHSNADDIEFPEGFDIQVGTIDGSIVRSELDSGNQSIVAVWEFDSGTFWNVTHLIYDYYYGGTRDLEQKFATVEALIVNGSATVGAKITQLNEPTTFWQEQFPVFTGTLPKANKVVWRLEHPTDGTAPNNQLALHVRQICARLVEGTTPTPTSSPPPATGTQTPTITPTATDTPTGTLAPTNTPGPTDTPGPSDTPAATGTPVIGGLAAGPAVFATIRPPQGCSDIYNPCGQLPFPVPPFGTIALPSPTRLLTATSAIGGTATPFMTPTYYGSPGPGTPTGTITGTPTPGPGAISVAAYATNIVGYATGIAGQGFGTPVAGFGFDGTTEDIRNSANEIGSNLGIFFGLVRALQTLFLGRAGTLIAFLLLAVVFIVLVKIFTFLLPVFITIVNFVLNVIKAIPFI